MDYLPEVMLLIVDIFFHAVMDTTIWADRKILLAVAAVVVSIVTFFISK